MLAVDDQVALEEPVPAVLAVGLGNVKELNIGGVTAHVPADDTMGKHIRSANTVEGLGALAAAVMP